MKPKDDAERAASPYSTGGGGTALERRIAVVYLAAMLTESTRSELGPSATIRRVAFQQAPLPVDDLIIDATIPSGEVRLAIAARRSPRLIRSDEDSTALVASMLRAIDSPAVTPLRLGLAVAGKQTAPSEVAELSHIARRQQDAEHFYRVLATPGKFRKPLRERLGHIEDLVAAAVPRLKCVDSTEDGTWRLLRALHVLAFRVEPPEEDDWDGLIDSLQGLVSGQGKPEAGALRNHLESLVAGYMSHAATVDAALLRSDASEHLALMTPQARSASCLLDDLDRVARRSVRRHAGGGNPGSPLLELSRESETASLVEAMLANSCVLLTGESGVGKSALALNAIERLERENGDQTRSISLNLRDLPASWLSFQEQLGTSLSTAFSQLAQQQLRLVIDGADAILEDKLDLFRYVVQAATDHRAALVVIASDDARQSAKDLLPPGAATHRVGGLTDSDFEELSNANPALRALLSEPRGRELFRRPVIVDLTLRSGNAELPISAAQAMTQVWRGLIRRDERTDRGLPDARDRTVRELAKASLLGVEPVGLDDAAVAGLRRDGILQPSSANPWSTVPDFTHDELRRYAVAHLLLASGDVSGAVAELGAPRWILSAAILAVQARLDLAPDAAAYFDEAQAGFDTDVASKFGVRWGDVPLEAALTARSADEIFEQAASGLLADEGLGRLIRLVRQRHIREGLADNDVVAPVTRTLLKTDEPWDQRSGADQVLKAWLRTHIRETTPVGNAERRLLLARIQARVDDGDDRLRKELAAEEERIAARTAEESHEAEGVARQAAELREAFGVPSGARRMGTVPSEFTELLVELLALLGPDLGTGANLLRRLVSEDPERIRPAVEAPLADLAICSFDPALLLELAEAYYRDDRPPGWSLMDDGIRHHSFTGGPMFAAQLGPFWWLLTFRPNDTITLLNRLLDHAAFVRTKQLDGSEPTSFELNLGFGETLYLGDSHVWRWYRGTGVGPYPLMSGLLALEKYCDDHLRTAPDDLSMLVELLLMDCSNLAMPALALGLIIRHLESASDELDPFLTEPSVWHLESARVAAEHSMLAAANAGATNPERRLWALREAATVATLNAPEERVGKLREAGQKLVSRAEQIGDPEAANLARAWASALDRDQYEYEVRDEQIVAQAKIPDDVRQAMAAVDSQLERVTAVAAIHMRYVQALDDQKAEQITLRQVEADLDAAVDLINDPPPSGFDLVDMAGALAGYASERVLQDGWSLSAAHRGLVAELLVAVADATNLNEHIESQFSLGGDRAVARVMPLLLVPSNMAKMSAAEEVESHVPPALHRIANAGAMETRLCLARGMDSVWASACTTEGERCHHEDGLQLAIELMRGCRLNFEGGSTVVERIEGDLVEGITGLDPRLLYVGQLDAGLRATTGAVASHACVSERACELLAAVLPAHARGIMSRDQDFDHHGHHALAAARACLAVTRRSDSELLLAYIDALAPRSRALATFIRGLAAAADEDTARAQVASEIWVDIIERVTDNFSLRDAHGDHWSYGAEVAAVVAPEITEYDFGTWEGRPHEFQNWRNPRAWATVLDTWIGVARGNANCVDAFLSTLSVLPDRDQVDFGLDRVGLLVDDPSQEIVSSSRLSDWLIMIRPSVGPHENKWQRVVDQLVVSGSRALAPYST